MVDRKLSSSTGEQLSIFAVIFSVFLLSVALCYWLLGVGNNPIDSIAKTFADFVGGDQYIQYAYGNSDNEFAPWVKWMTLIACIIGSVVFQGLLIATLTNVIQSRAVKVQNGEIRYRLSNHYLVFGYNESVPALVERLCDTGKDVVVVVAKDVVNYRNTLMDIFGDKNNVYVLRGEKCSVTDLNSLYVHEAERVFIMGDNSLPNSDLQNLDCYRTISKTIGADVDCYVQICDQSVYDLVVHSGEADIQHFHPFNIEEMCTRQLLVDSDNIYLKPDYPSPQVNIHTHPEKQVHFVIIGFSTMGEALCREAALLLHYPNYVKQGIKTRITCIDKGVSQKMQPFVGRHKTLFDCSGYSLTIVDAMGQERRQDKESMLVDNFLDVEFEFIDAIPQGIFVMNKLETWNNDSSCLLSIAICGESDTGNYQLGYSLPQSLYSGTTSIYVCQKKKRSGDNLRNKHVQFFGFEDVDITAEAKEIDWGKYINYIYNQLYAESEVATGKSINEVAEQLWKYLSIDKRWSNIYNASSLLFKLRGIGIENIDRLRENPEVLNDYIDILSEVEHNRWNVEQLLHGYRPTSKSEHLDILADPAKKKIYKQSFVHDDLRPFSELDDYTKDKDKELILYLTKAVLNNTVK